jgi:NADPH:quinone reductase-like Zn-dependent oxidoreductase
VFIGESVSAEAAELGAGTPHEPAVRRRARLIDAGHLRPVVDAVFPLSRARQAYEHKPTCGKIIPRIADRADEPT